VGCFRRQPSERWDLKMLDMQDRGQRQKTAAFHRRRKVVSRLQGLATA
jgi:hypothetical protein